MSGAKSSWKGTKFSSSTLISKETFIVYGLGTQAEDLVDWVIDDFDALAAQPGLFSFHAFLFSSCFF